MGRFLSVLLLLTATAHAEPLRVAVAANFAPTLVRLAPLFKADTGHRLIISSGSTGKLLAQVVHGAPYDLLLAADAVRTVELERRGFVAPDGRFTYALGRLALVSKRGDLPPGPAALTDDREGRIALADPRVAPYGEAAMTVLLRLGVKDNRRLVFGENVAQAFHFVAAGGAPYGLVAASLIPHGEKEGVRRLWDVPASICPPIVQQGVVLKRGANGKTAFRFVDFLLHDPAAMKIIAEEGYRLPDPEPSP